MLYLLILSYILVKTTNKSIVFKNKEIYIFEIKFLNPKNAIQCFNENLKFVFNESLTDFTKQQINTIFEKINNKEFLETTYLKKMDQNIEILINGAPFSKIKIENQFDEFNVNDTNYKIVLSEVGKNLYCFIIAKNIPKNTDKKKNFLIGEFNKEFNFVFDEILEDQESGPFIIISYKKN